jgi:DNA-binding FadR family transcriptional regulator
MLNSPLIFPQAVVFNPRDEYRAFARGYNSAGRKTPAHIAWILETEAADQCWVVGRLVGSERDLIERFGVSRDAVRQAIRVLESRGSMVMERGRHGGLRLKAPSLDWAASGFATYLRACGFCEDKLQATSAVAEPFLANIPSDHVVVQLYRRTLELLATRENARVDFKARGFLIATRLIQRYIPIPNEGVHIGSEEALCERFSSSRATLRQALHILDDLDMLQVQRGRGGGYLLKRPIAIGVVRQLFAILATRQQTLQDVLPIKWTFDLIKLRLALRALRELKSSERAQYFESLSLIVAGAREPARWCLLQKSLGKVAKNPLVNTLLWSLVLYDVRVGSHTAGWDEIDTSLRAEEEAIIAAMSEGLEDEAEIRCRRTQSLIAELLYRSETAAR